MNADLSVCGGQARPISAEVASGLLDVLSPVLFIALPYCTLVHLVVLFGLLSHCGYVSLFRCDQ